MASTHTMRAGVSGVAVFKPGIKKIPMVSKESQKRKFIQYVKSTCKRINIALAKRGIPASVNVRGIDKISHEVWRTSDLLIQTTAEYSENPSRSGVLHDSQIETFADLLASYKDLKKSDLPWAKKPPLNRVIFGPTQVGKAGTLAIATFFLPIFLYMMTGRIVRPHKLLPNKRKLTKQVRDAFHLFYRLHSQFLLCYKGQELSMQEYHSQICGMKVDPNEFIQTNSVRSKNHFQKALKSVQEAGGTMMLVNDEFHHGSDREGVFAKLAEDVLDLINSGSQEAMMISASATGWELMNHKDKFQCIMHFIAPGYVGPYFFNGELFPVTDKKKFKANLPVLKKYSEEFSVDELQWGAFSCVKTFYNKVMVPHLAEVEGKPLNDIKKFKYLTAKERADLKPHLLEYQRKFIATITKMIVALLAKSPMGEGACIRVAKKNSDAEQIMAGVERELKRLFQGATPTLVRGFGPTAPSYGEDTTMAEMIRDKANGNRFVVFVTGEARMGTNFDPECRFFIDLTPDSLYNTTEMQGLYGRACGYGKDTVVLVSDRTYKSIQSYITNMGLSREKDAHMRVNIVHEHGVSKLTKESHVSYIGLDYDRISRLAAEKPRKQIFRRAEKLMKKILDEAMVPLNGKRGGSKYNATKENSVKVGGLMNRLAALVEADPRLISTQPGYEFRKGSIKVARVPVTAAQAAVQAKALKSGKANSFAIDAGDENGLIPVSAKVIRRWKWKRAITRTSRILRTVKDGTREFQQQVFIKMAKKYMLVRIELALARKTGAHMEGHGWKVIPKEDSTYSKLQDRGGENGKK